MDSSSNREPLTKKHLEGLKGIIRGTVPPPPVAKLVGFEFLSIELGRSEFALEAGPQHANPMGTMHGGIVCDLADAALGTAMASTLEDDETYTTLDLTVKFLKPVWNTRLRAVAKLVKRTRSLGLIECDVTDASGSIVARGYSTCIVLRGESARGR